MDISPVEGSLSYVEEEFLKDPPSWETTGKVAFWAFTAIACGALVPVVFGKKKKVASISMASPTPSTSSSPIATPSEIPSVESCPYEALPCSKEDQGHVRFIVESIHRWVQNSFLGVPWATNPLEVKHRGKKIEHLHPFKFLEICFEQPKAMKAISKSVCWTEFMGMGFISGINRGMEREANNLMHHLEPFAAKVGVSPDLLRPSIQRREWRRFADCLVENICGLR